MECGYVLAPEPPVVVKGSLYTPLCDKRKKGGKAFAGVCEAWPLVHHRELAALRGRFDGGKHRQLVRW